MTDGRDSKGRFTSEGNIGRPIGARDHRNIFLAALKAQGETEADFAEAILEKAREGHATALTVAATRIWKEPKSVLPTFQIEFPEDASDLDKVNAIVAACASGELPADVGAAMTSILETKLKLVEMRDLADRLYALEAKT